MFNDDVSFAFDVSDLFPNGIPVQVLALLSWCFIDVGQIVQFVNLCGWRESEMWGWCCSCDYVNCGKNERSGQPSPFPHSRHIPCRLLERLSPKLLDLLSRTSANSSASRHNKLNFDKHNAVRKSSLRAPESCFST